MSTASPTVRVEKATSDLLIGPDWTMNMEICDSINSDHWWGVIFIDMQVRDKILVLLDSWQEAFGGPGGKYPQYYWAYEDLKRSGVEFPRRSPDAAPIFTPPVTHPTIRHPQPRYGMPNTSSITLDEAMSSEMGNMSLSDLESMKGVTELLSDMLQAVDPNNCEGIKDEVIVDLVSQCRANQKKLMQLLSSTGDEELLFQGLSINDNLQNLLATHDAIASGHPLPPEPSPCSPPLQFENSESSPKTNASTSSITAVNGHHITEDEDEEDDDFAQLARRNTKFRPVAHQSTSTSVGDNWSDPIAPSTPSTTDASSSSLTNTLSLPDPPTSVRTTTIDQDMVDFLSIVLVPNSTSPHTPLTPQTPPPPLNQGSSSSHVPIPPNNQVYTNTSEPYLMNQYVAPWAQPQSQFHNQYSSSYPPPPWATTDTTPPNTSASNVPTQPTQPLQHYNSFGSRGNTEMPSRPLQHYHSFGSRGNASVTVSPTVDVQKSVMTGPTTQNKPFIPSYRLFEDLVDMKNKDGGFKASGSSNSLFGASTTSGMIGGRK
ncbi:hypothetical protein QJS10_CPA03g01010 [Acorus calamus]|uniref:Uncharacterized protein n=1 Tax=Acorus calamus TaxID=4465 RepID=A0AAV9F6I7_ACOCL|nr:hypothetical protein QJS10_CPA03g01010 [Acorus calamus]